MDSAHNQSVSGVPSSDTAAGHTRVDQCCVTAGMFCGVVCSGTELVQGHLPHFFLLPSICRIWQVKLLTQIFMRLSGKGRAIVCCTFQGQDAGLWFKITQRFGMKGCTLTPLKSIGRFSIALIVGGIHFVRDVCPGNMLPRGMAESPSVEICQEKLDWLAAQGIGLAQQSSHSPSQCMGPGATCNLQQKTHFQV